MPGDDTAAQNAGSVAFRELPFGTFCDAGDLASCPCGVPGSLDTGCELPQQTGGVGLDVVARETWPRNRMTLAGSGFPDGSVPAVVMRASSRLSGPSILGDGLSCLTAPLVRVSATSAVGGSSRHTLGHSPSSGAGAFHYQLWFRTTPLSFCDPASAFSLSNGRSVTW